MAPSLLITRWQGIMSGTGFDAQAFAHAHELLLLERRLGSRLTQCLNEAHGAEVFHEFGAPIGISNFHIGIDSPALNRLVVIANAGHDLPYVKTAEGSTELRARGMLIASVTGRTTNYVSGGERNSHQGPPGGNIVAAVVRI